MKIEASLAFMKHVTKHAHAYNMLALTNVVILALTRTCMLTKIYCEGENSCRKSIQHDGGRERIMSYPVLHRSNQWTKSAHFQSCRLQNGDYINSGTDWNGPILIATFQFSFSSFPWISLPHEKFPQASAVLLTIKLSNMHHHRAEVLLSQVLLEFHDSWSQLQSEIPNSWS